VQASNFEVEGVRTYPWNDFEAFSVNGAVSDKWDELVLKFRRPVRPRLRVNVPKGRSEEVVKALGKSLPQVEPEPSFIDNLERFFGF
jgi:16S rRNA C967 or C1407 C5-methylase (RsmB/RsmF family)